LSAGQRRHHPRDQLPSANTSHAIKGGQLARLAEPAAVEALLLSDVIGDNLDVIGSGPTAPDASTFAGALGILNQVSRSAERCPASVRERLENGRWPAIDETPEATPRPQYRDRQQPPGARWPRRAMPARWATAP
jgi:glycerate-2-kinase